MAPGTPAPGTPAPCTPGKQRPAELLVKPYARGSEAKVKEVEEDNEAFHQALEEFHLR